MTTYRLDAGGQSLVLAIATGLAKVIFWGPRLPTTEDLNVWLFETNDALERLRMQNDAALFHPAALKGSRAGRRIRAMSDGPWHHPSRSMARGDLRR